MLFLHFFALDLGICLSEKAIDPRASETPTDDHAGSSRFGE